MAMSNISRKCVICGCDTDGMLLTEVDKDDDDVSFRYSSLMVRFDGRCVESSSLSNPGNTSDDNRRGGKDENDGDNEDCDDDGEFTLDSNAISDMSSMVYE